MASGLGLEETELRLGIPGGGSGGSGGGGRGVGAEAEAVKSASKRGFAEIIDLKLQLHAPALDTDKEEEEEAAEREAANKRPVQCTDPEKPPAAKAQVVGWPPVRSFRRNIACSEGDDRASGGGGFVKVSMDGAPYLRKVHLRKYRSYQDLSAALGNMFCSFAGAADRSLPCVKVAPVDLANGSELYVPTYEDKDGDWMLVGDVPWELFVDSCKRLRIMKGSEAVGLAPREKEKQKNRR